MTNEEIVTLVASHMAIFAADFEMIDVNRMRILVAGSDLTISIVWHDFAYSNIGRGCREEGEEPTFECLAWNGEWNGSENANPHFMRGWDPLAYATLAEIERATLRALTSVTTEAV